MKVYRTTQPMTIAVRLADTIFNYVLPARSILEERQHYYIGTLYGIFDKDSVEENSELFEQIKPETCAS